MSDSYSAWCEEQEDTYREQQKKEIEKIKKSAEFKKRLSSANKKLNDVEFDWAIKCCKNCANRRKLNRDVCKELAIEICDTDMVCSIWKHKSDASNDYPLLAPSTADPDLLVELMR